MFETMAKVNWIWFVLAATWLYESGVFIFAVLPSLTEWYDPVPPPDTIKILLLVAAIFHGVVFLVYALWMRKPRSMHTWHYGYGLWAYAWPTVAAWLWDSTFGPTPALGAVYDETATQGYILWKAILLLASIAALTTMQSLMDTVRNSFTHRRWHKK